MSTKVTIDNFQSIKRAEFEFSGLTVVVGGNNIGKSALVRAIDSALTNATGSSFIRKGEKSTTVRVEHKSLDIEWKKGDKTLYKVNGEAFSALNRSIPKPMIDAGFGKMQMGEKMVNPILAAQFDELFLLDKPGAVVTDVLADLYDLNVLNDSDSECQKDLRAAKSLQKVRDADLSTIKESLVKFTGFEDLKLASETMATIEKKCIDLKEQIEELISYENGVKSHQEEIKRLGPVGKIKILSPNSSGVLLLECQQIGVWEEDVQTRAKTVKALKAAHSVVVPEQTATKVLMEELTEVSVFELAVRKSSVTVQALSGAHKIVVPDPTPTESLSKETKEITALETAVRTGSNTVKTLSGISEVNLIGAQSLVKSLGNIVVEIATLQTTEDSFSTSVKDTKEARDVLRKATSDLEELQKEMGTFDICPLCERPMHEDKHD